MHAVWIGSAGTGTGFGLAVSLRDTWGSGVRIVAADVNPPELVAASLLADETRQVPYTAAPEFREALLGGLAESGADTYVPILDAEIVLARRLSVDGRLPGSVALAAPPLEAALLCLDKLAMAAWMADRGIPSPATWAPDAAPRDGRELFAKPRQGVGSVGARALTSLDDLLALSAADDAEDFVVQQGCQSPEVTVDAFRGRAGGPVQALCRERLEVKAGVCTKARVFTDPEIGDLAERLGAGLGLEGAFCFQVMRDVASGWVVTDVNARHGAGSRMSAAVGFDIMAANMADLWGEDASRYLVAPDIERIVLRQYAEYVSR